MNAEMNIDPEDVIQNLDSAVKEVFEMMLGLSCAPLAEDSSILPTITASIRLFGTNKIDCLLCGTDCTAKVLAEAFVGSLGEDSDAIIADSFGELCNMVAGNWKNKLGPQHASSSLTTPAISRFAEAQQLADDGTCFKRYYRFDQEVFGIVLVPVDLDGAKQSVQPVWSPAALPPAALA